MIVCGVINVVLITGVAAWGSWGPLGVAIAGSVVWTIRNVFYVPIYTAHIMKLRWHVFFPSLIITAIGTFVASFMAYGLTLVRMPTGWLALGASASIVSLSYAIFVTLFLMNRADWLLLKSILLKRA
jgi:hypothetical protein